MIYLKFLPSPVLKNYVHSFSYIEIENEEDFPFTGWIIPDGYPEIYLFEGERMEISLKEDQVKFTQSFACGLLENSVRYMPSGKCRYWSIKLKTWAADFFYNNSQSELKGAYFTLKDLSHKRSLEILNDVWLYRDKLEAVAFIETQIYKRIRKLKSGQETAKRATELIFATSGNVQIQQICSQINISRQYLERQYQEYIGLTPKCFARTFRVRQVVNQVVKNPFHNFTQLALAFGYFDQSHFIRDFKIVAGKSPKQFFKEQHFIMAD